MKLLAAVAVAFLVVCPALAQTRTPNPFTPKSKAVPVVSTTQRAVIVFATRPMVPHQDAAYHVFVGEQAYHASGVGPKTAGIYDVEVYPETSLIVVHEYHPGGIKGDPDTQFRLQILSEYNHEPAETKADTFTVDGRRLLVYKIVKEMTGIVYQALAVDHATSTETYFTAVTPLSGLGLGAYDFLITPNNDGSKTLNVYTIQRDGAVIIYPLSIAATSVYHPGKRQ